MGNSYEEYVRKEREALAANIKSAVNQVTSFMEKYGVSEITARYSGSGDDGHFYEIVSDDCDISGYTDLVEEVDNLGRLLLARNYEGWEINGGSQGTLYLELEDGKLGASIEHAWLQYVEEPPIDALPDDLFDEPKAGLPDTSP